MGLEIITTADGSHSLFHSGLNETYHSVHGALQESAHVFIKNGLDFFVTQNPGSPIKVFEVGFGTALNALLTLQRASDNNLNVHYTTLEAFPLPEEIWSRLNYDEYAGVKEHFTTLHQVPWSVEKNITANFTILKIPAELQRLPLAACCFDVVFFDAFAPGKQPEMWSLSNLKKVTEALKPHGVFVTYCARGQLKRDLKEIGLTVQTLQGPPGKKEMVRAIKFT